MVVLFSSFWSGAFLSLLLLAWCCLKEKKKEYQKTIARTYKEKERTYKENTTFVKQHVVNRKKRVGKKRNTKCTLKGNTKDKRRGNRKKI